MGTDWSSGPVVDSLGPETIGVLIVDGHAVVRQGLRTFLELHGDVPSGDPSALPIEVVGEAANVVEWESFLCLGMCIGLIYAFQRYANRRGELARFLSRNAYAAYLIHECDQPGLVGGDAAAVRACGEAAEGDTVAVRDETEIEKEEALRV